MVVNDAQQSGLKRSINLIPNSLPKSTTIIQNSTNLSENIALHLK